MRLAREARDGRTRWGWLGFAGCIELWIARALALALTLGACGGGAHPPLPVLELDALDPAVARAVETALAELERAPGSAAAWGRLGLVCEANGLPADAVDCYAAAASLAGAAREAPRVEWRYRQAVCLAASGRAKESERALHELVERRPDDADALVALGERALDRGAIDEACALFVDATRRAPNAAAAWIALARARLGADELDAAAEAARRAIELDPKDRHAHHVLGSALRGAGRIDEAGPHLALGAGAERTRRDPHEALLAQARASDAAALDAVRELAAGGREAESIPLLAGLLEEEPRSLFLLNRLALAHAAAHDPRAGIPLLERALELEPENLRSLVNLALLREMAGETDAALATLRRALEIDPELARAHELEGAILRAHGRLAEAAACWERALALDERNRRMWIGLGEMQLDLADWQGAAASLERAIELEPESGDAHALNAIARWRMGRAEEARVALARAEALAPKGSRTLAAARSVLGATAAGGEER